MTVFEKHSDDDVRELSFTINAFCAALTFDHNEGKDWLVIVGARLIATTQCEDNSGTKNRHDNTDQSDNKIPN